MKYKIIKGTVTFKALIVLKERIVEVNAVARQIVSETGAKEYYKANNCVAGGISGIKFAKRPSGWKRLKRLHDTYYPQSSNKSLLERIAELPLVSYDELNQIVKFEAPQEVADKGDVTRLILSPGLVWGEEVILMSVEPGSVYSPPADVIEIVESEYNSLKSEIKK
jgi:hypothetical protein